MIEKEKIIICWIYVYKKHIKEPLIKKLFLIRGSFYKKFRKITKDDVI